MIKISCIILVMEPSDLFQVTVREVDHSTVALDLAGELDLLTAPLLSEAVDQATANGYRRMVLDLSRLGFMDSTGLSLLVDAQRRMAAKQGGVTVVCPLPPVRQILSLTGLDSVLAVVESDDQACTTA